MSRPSYDARIDWNRDGDFNGTGENLTARVFDRGTSLSMRYGRDQGRAFAPLSGGRGQFELNNRSRDYSPENTASPLAGLVGPGRDLRITATFEGTTYGLLRGLLDGYEVLPGREQQSVQVTAIDGLARLNRTQVSTALYHSVRTGQAVALLLDAVGWPTALRDLDIGATTIPWWWAEGTTAFAALQEILDAEGPGSLATVDIDGRFVYRDRHHRLLRPASTTAQATWRSGGTEPCYSTPMTYDPGWADIVNSIDFSIPVRVPAGQLAEVWRLDGSRSLANGETISLSAKASDPFTGAIAPAAGTDFNVTAGSGSVTIALSRTSGQSATVLVTATGGPVTIDGMTLRAYPIVTQTTVQVLAEDPASIDEFERLSWPTDRQPTLASLPDAISIADIILAHRARRQPTVTVTFRGGVPARLRQQLGRNLSDRVRIVDSGTGLNADFWVERIEHGIADLDHATTFACERVPTPAANPFRFDTSGAGFDQGRFGDTGRDDPASMFIFDHATQGRFDVGLFAN